MSMKSLKKKLAAAERSGSSPNQGIRGREGSAKRLAKPFYTGADDLAPGVLPSLADVSTSERLDLFRKKMELCCTLYDFSDSQADVNEKELKKQTLMELVEYVNSTKNVFSEQVMADVIKMVSVNIFRTIKGVQGSSKGPTLDPDEEEPTLEPAWPHLQIIYEFFLRFIISNEVDPKVVKKFLENSFITNLLELFNSEDPRERDYLKTILHRIYGKFMALRSFIRKSTQHVFFKFIYESEEHSGIAELLEILGSIINGFALPLKEEHKVFLEKSLIPLHRVKSLAFFHQQLVYCMTQFVEKDPRLSEMIINGLIRYWPLCNSAKEVLFLSEIEDILELTQGTEFQHVEEALFKRICRCISSPHFQVSERALFLWNNDYMVNLVNQNKAKIFGIIVGPLIKNSKVHWNTTVQGLTYNVLKMLMDLDGELFEDCSVKFREEEELKYNIRNENAERWKELERIHGTELPDEKIFKTNDEAFGNIIEAGEVNLLGDDVDDDDDDDDEDDDAAAEELIHGGEDDDDDEVARRDREEAEVSAALGIQGGGKILSAEVNVKKTKLSDQLDDDDLDDDLEEVSANQ
mmetsp:Transcript_63812/g.73162  ORF Transcript_63812/g.73162 Transcript_63812/m.73162 type:complete len:578 (+) Transcript_63812:292-2025(+)